MVAAAFAAHAPALGLPFTRYDDPVYVTENPHVAQGLGAGSVRWAFTRPHAGNWHPLTWLSHMLDVELFGMDPAGHHATNLLLHALNAVLLYGALVALTGRAGRSAAVAALFAVHPVQVESVAWVAERKNLLSTGFALLAVWAWAGFARRGGAGRYAAVAGAMAASLLAKPMAVTLPGVLLLLDVWPLARIGPAAVPGGRQRGRPASAARLVVEKLPLLALSVAVSAVTLVTQARAGALAPAHDVGLDRRLLVAAVSGVRYLRQVAWPTDLAVLYPHPELPGGTPVSPAEGLAALLALGAITAGALALRRRGYPPVGWLWFLGTLVPVSGVVQVGWQAGADRYLYLPLIGLLLAVVWGAADLAERALGLRRARAAQAALLLATLVPLGWATRAQLAWWETPRRVFERALAVTGPSPVMHNELGVLLAEQGEYAQAVAHLERATEIHPLWAAAQRNLGLALAGAGRLDEALGPLRRAAVLDPGNAEAWRDWGRVLLAGEAPEEALPRLTRALELAPDDPIALHAAAQALLLQPDPARRDPRRAARLCERALRGDESPPPQLLETLSRAYAAGGRLPEAVAAARSALSRAQASGSPDAERLGRHLARLEAALAARHR